MSIENKFREFYINDDNSVVKFVFKCKTEIDSVELINPDIVHVIEYSAYEQLKRENFDLQVELDQARDPAHCNLCGSCGIDMCCKAHGCAHPSIKSETLKELGDDVKELLTENEQLKSKLEIAKKGLESIVPLNEDGPYQAILAPNIARQALKEISEG